MLEGYYEAERLLMAFLGRLYFRLTLEHTISLVANHIDAQLSHDRRQHSPKKVHVIVAKSNLRKLSCGNDVVEAFRP